MNIILTGMPGAGKSTIGPALAVRLGMGFADTDTLMKQRTGRELKEIVAAQGFEAFLKLQEETILTMELANTVIATGGSVVCSEPSMLHLKNNGKVVYLKLGFGEIEKRLAPDRRLARSAGKSLEEVYHERSPLYEKYADIPVDCTDKSVEAIVEEICRQLPES